MLCCFNSPQNHIWHFEVKVHNHWSRLYTLIIIVALVSNLGLTILKQFGFEVQIFDFKKVLALKQESTISCSKKDNYDQESLSEKQQKQFDCMQHIFWEKLPQPSRKVSNILRFLPKHLNSNSWHDSHFKQI